MKCPHFKVLEQRSSTVYRGVLSGSWNRGILILGCLNRGVPLYTKVSSFQGVGTEEFRCIRYPHFRVLEQRSSAVYRGVLISEGWIPLYTYRGVLISEGWIPLYTYRGVLISEGWIPLYTYRGVLISKGWNREVPLYTEVSSLGSWNRGYRGVLISGCWNRGVPEVFSFQRVAIEKFHCILFA